jgi:hypothetical protein
MYFHDPLSLGIAFNSKLLVKGTNKGQASSPVRTGHFSPVLHAKKLSDEHTK